MNSNHRLVIDDEPEICEFVKDVAEENAFESASPRSSARRAECERVVIIVQETLRCRSAD